MESDPMFNLVDEEAFASIIFTMFKIPLKKFPPIISEEPIHIGQNCWISTNSPLVLDDMWRNWLGGIISDRIEKGPGRIVLTAKSINTNETPESLMQRISNVFWGLTIVAGIPHFDTGDTIQGRYSSDELKGKTGIKIGFGIRRVYTNQLLELLKKQSYTDLTKSDFDQTLIFSNRIGSIVKNISRERINRKTFYDKSITDFFTRILSGYEALREGMTSYLPMERLHQFARAIEALLPADVMGRSDYKNYLMKLIDPHPENEKVLLQIYDLRSAQEHHLPFDAKVKKKFPNIQDFDKLAWTRTRQAESLAREFFRRFLASQNDYVHHFENETTLKNFWTSGDAVTVWGSPFDLQRIT